MEILLRREGVLNKHEVGAIILTPTRELAQQISAVLKHLTENTCLSQVMFIGGKSMQDNIKEFQADGGNIIIATPGKLLALLEHKEETFQLRSSVKSLEILILDEADRLLSQSNFEASLNSIFSYLPKQRRTSLFSATQTDKVESFVRAGLRNPVQVVVREKKKAGENGKRTPDALQNYYVVCPADEKLKKLVAFLRLHRTGKHLVFFNTCASVEYFSKLLDNILKSIPVVSIHGKMKKKRNEIFKKFQGMKCGILMCTDVMARGIDFPNVNWVVQYDPPSNAEVFVHRCGRTARMGNIGRAIIFLLPNESHYVDFVRINQKVPLEEYSEWSDDIPDMKSKVRKLVKNDRELYEKGKRAFVSFIQCYQKHECSLLFQFKELDICKLADGFGLLHLPKMPELKGLNVEDFLSSEIDTDSIRYKDKVREKQRQVKLEKKKSETKKTFPKHTKSWSKEKLKNEKKFERKEKKSKKRKLLENVGDDDIDDLLREGRLLKKLKKGKITEKEFQKQMNEPEEREVEDTVPS